MENKTLGEIACAEYQKYDASQYWSQASSKKKLAWEGVARAIETQVVSSKRSDDNAMLLSALKQIAGLWPEGTTADIMAVHGANDGKSRAIYLKAAIDTAKAAIAKFSAFP